MSDDPFSMPDVDEIARQMEEAMAEAQRAMDGLPQLGDTMGALSALMRNLPS
ncbi:MAG: hypothetical protein MUQ10_19425 [Anaerolineae bacterium]|nr:hypothetical protein [Anaerolineae bacterium]